MLNCKRETYSSEPETADGYSFKEFRAGTKYKWGEYDGGELLINVSAGQAKSLTGYFSKVGQYSAQG